jgi:capsid protein
VSGTRLRSVPSTAGWFGLAREDYDATKQTRFQRKRSGIPSLGSSADYHYRNDSEYLRMLEYARDMERNDSVGGPLIERAVDNTVKCGFGLDVDTGDRQIDSMLAARWEEWATNASDCDLSGVMTFSDMERMVFRRTLVDGDIIGLPITDGLPRSEPNQKANRSRRAIEQFEAPRKILVHKR